MVYSRWLFLWFEKIWINQFCFSFNLLTDSMLCLLKALKSLFFLLFWVVSRLFSVELMSLFVVFASVRVGLGRF